jgi:Holliday junction resolvase-like predicted endonuclease
MGLKHSQGYGLNSAEKKAVETRAMELANKWLVENGYKTQDMSANEPYDFLATKDGKQVFVEVKGKTSNDPTSILMTANEVKLHKAERGSTAIGIVSSIKLKKGSFPTADGGILVMEIGWNIDDWISEPTAYRLEKKAIF